MVRRGSEEHCRYWLWRSLTGGHNSLESLRPTLQSAPYILPEDAFEEAVEPYRLDVFMLAVIAYRICFAGESLLTLDRCLNGELH